MPSSIEHLTTQDVKPVRGVRRENSTATAPESMLPTVEAILLRKLQSLDRDERYDRLRGDTTADHNSGEALLSSASTNADLPASVDDTITALLAIKSTPYESSFASRLQGGGSPRTTGVLSVDWEARSEWMDLMRDIRVHHVFSHPERSQANECDAPIQYVSMQSDHLRQIHDLLTRVFWTSIDVSDSLRYSPEQCTVVAVYKKIVIGVAILSSPDETYLTYLAVRSGWENCRIATTMLYHLIALNPNKDITLHVSASSPAMILYNRFGFKAEQFIAGFYDAYADPRSHASKNAFRLRLRR